MPLEIAGTRRIATIAAPPGRILGVRLPSPAPIGRRPLPAQQHNHYQMLDALFVNPVGRSLLCCAILMLRAKLALLWGAF